MPQMKVNDMQYHYEVSGRGEPLVLLHGFTGSSENWQQLVSIAADRYLTIAIDLPGHGRSDSPPDVERYRMERCAEDMVAILDQLSLSPVHLLGYSMGGRLALYLAARHRSAVRTLTLESASPGLEEETERRERARNDRRLADDIEGNGIRAFVDAWAKQPLFASQRSLPAAVRNRLRAQRMQNRPVGLANSLRGMGTGAQPSLWSELPLLNLPCLLLAGGLDQKFVAIGRRMAALMPAARFEVVPGSGHAIHLERPDLFARLVLDFLTQTSIEKQ